MAGDAVNNGSGDSGAATGTSTDEAPPATATLAGRVAFSSHGKPWMIVLKPTPRGKAIDRFITRWTGMSLISYEFAKAAGRPYHREHVLLTTIGSQSGQLRTSCLPFFRYGDDLVVCGTKGGGPKNPFWVGNIEADNRCWVRINRRDSAATARVATGAERAAVFAEVARQHPDLERYQAQTEPLGRDIPLVLLTLRAEPSGGADGH
jgi:deazaflavin-dependent oxidoreductase (nitroreductase family)